MVAMATTAQATETARPPPPEPPRRLILLFDGTWNDVEFGERDTSIVRLRELIDQALPDREARPHTAADGPETFVFYRRGVGTDGPLDRLRGGVLGFGVDANIRRGYRFLARHYRPGDHIYVFGFSRGAFTARSLVGYLAAAGLLTSQTCTPEREAAAWAYYRTHPDDRLPGDWQALGQSMHPRAELRVRALGVFDTVGALGVPGNAARVLNRLRYAFHTLEMPTITDVNLHAVAIDEQRPAFVATLWRQHKFKMLEHPWVTEQVWFPGVHADIGGGYFDGEARPEGLRALDDIPLDWMLRRLTALCPEFPAPPHLGKPLRAGWSRAEAHDSFGWPFTLGRRAHRAIANRTVAAPPGHEVVGRERLERPVGEAVHVSALDRLGERVTRGGRGEVYAPPVLLAMLDDLAKGEVPVIGWDGDRIADAARVVAAARARLTRR
jgi:hypothetical protein